MAGNKFPNQNVTFFDSRRCGGVSVRGFFLETDDDGFVEAPPALADELAPHGFLRKDRPDPAALQRNGARK